MKKKMIFLSSLATLILLSGCGAVTEAQSGKN